MVATEKQWTFILTGEVRSGASVLASSINNRGGGAICRTDLLHPDDAVRREAHESYFGASDDPKNPDWYVDGLTNPWQYIDRTAFHAMEGQKSVGCYIPYQMVRKLELYDLFESKWREGGFSVIQIVRNPVACFVSWKQAVASGIWSRPWSSTKATRTPGPVRINAEELTAFCREHSATLSKIRATCEDRLEVHYRDLVQDYQSVMRAVFDHVEIPEAPVFARPGCKRLRNRTIAERVTNWTEVKLEVPNEVRRLIDSEDLF